MKTDGHCRLSVSPEIGCSFWNAWMLAQGGVQMQILDGVTTVAHHRIVSMGCTCSKFSLRGGSRAFVIPAWICLVMQNWLPNGCTVLNWLLPEHARQLFFCCNLLNLLYSPDFHCLDVMEFMDIIRTFMQHFPKTPLSLRSAAVLAAPGPGCQRRVTIDTLTAISDPILDDYHDACLKMRILSSFIPCFYGQRLGIRSFYDYVRLSLCRCFLLFRALSLVVPLLFRTIWQFTWTL